MVLCPFQPEIVFTGRSGLIKNRAADNRIDDAHEFRDSQGRFVEINAAFEAVPQRRKFIAAEDTADSVDCDLLPVLCVPRATFAASAPSLRPRCTRRNGRQGSRLWG